MQVSEKAKEQISTSLASIRDQAGEEVCYRLIKEDKSLKFSIDPPGTDDETISHNDTTILAVTPEAARTCKDSTLDVDEAGHFVLVKKDETSL